MKDFIPVVFALLTGLFWGTYGPVLAESRSYLKSPFKPYVAIGIAYLIWGIGGGVVGMLYKKDEFEGFTGPGMLWGLAAGTLGAWLGGVYWSLSPLTGGRDGKRQRRKVACTGDCGVYGGDCVAVPPRGGGSRASTSAAR